MVIYMNVGKVFEQQFKKSVPDYCALIRLRDEAQSFVKSEYSKYSHKNPFDFIMFDSMNRLFYCLELKSTKQKYIGYEQLNSMEKQSKMIKKHQIEGLLKYSKFNNTVCGFLLNFRDEKNDMERTYFLHINNFMDIYNNTKKRSLNEVDILMHGGIKIFGSKKRIHYTWDIDKFCIENG